MKNFVFGNIFLKQREKKIHDKKTQSKEVKKSQKIYKCLRFFVLTTSDKRNPVAPNEEEAFTI